MHKANNRGYSLLEVMIVLLIMSILAMAAVPLYQRHLVKSRRYEAEQVLIASALALEHYHQTARSYKGATLSNLNVDLQTISDYYTVLVTYKSSTSYVVSAIPNPNQDDKACGTLTLNQLGQRGYSGVAKLLSDCW